MAEVMLREHREDEAISYLEDVFRRQSSVILVARLEELLLKKGDPSRIINLYQDALSSGDNSVMKFFLAKLYFRLEMLDDALETLDSIEDQSLSEEIARIRGMIYHKRGQFDMAAQQFINTFSIGSILKIPYCCSNCNFLSENYSGRCPSCKRWNTFTFNIYGTCKVETARSSPQQ
jgi:predicted negative regulator of RcsB-dependent stress response